MVNHSSSVAFVLNRLNVQVSLTIDECGELRLKNVLKSHHGTYRR